MCPGLKFRNHSWAHIYMFVHVCDLCTFAIAACLLFAHDCFMILFGICACYAFVILCCSVPARCCDCLRVTYVSRRAVPVYCLKPSLQSTIWCERCLSVIHVAWCSLIMFPACARFINEYVCSLCTFHYGIYFVIASLPNTKLWGRCASWVYVS